VRIGVTLPTFTTDAGAVLEAARAAEAAGLHGIFSFDHQWPLGHPERPSLSAYPVLGAVGAATSSIAIGTLVARVGLLPDEVVAASLGSLAAIVGERLIAGLGTGDAASEPEHTRYGLPYYGVATRLGRLAHLADRLGSLGIECWIGGGSPATNRTADEAGVTLNFWGTSPERIVGLVERLEVPVTWGGPVPGGAGEAAELLGRLRDAGATWAVWAWPRSLELVREAAARAGIVLEGAAGTR
jgi:alkanesulfonate monooxygenase SsuD/methylene tetrahydromethanopterin reductase-like flavin-dependent oxidoreductase (luciferase family)